MVPWLLQTFVFSLLLCIGKGGNPTDMVYGAALLGNDDLTISQAPLAECVQECQANPKCNSIDYRFSDNSCSLSSASQLPLYVNTEGWNYIEINRVKNLQNFLKVEKASLSPMTALDTVLYTTPENCATTCFLTKTCKSFVISRDRPHTCLLYKEDTTNKKVTVYQVRDFYQLRTSNPTDMVYGAALLGNDDLNNTHAPLAECVQECQANPKCNSIDYLFSDKGCWFSSASQLPLYANTNGWNYIEINRVKIIQNFLKVEKASLSPSTVLESVLGTTPETCATTCLLTETCKSFEIFRNSPYTCIVYKEDTADKKMTLNQDRDFYQLRRNVLQL